MDLIVFDLPNFDMIIRIDFLETYGSEIDCWHKKIWFNLNDGDQLDFDKGHMIIIAIKVRKMLNKGCTGFLAHVVSKVESSVNIDKMPVVQKFSDVFSKELPRSTPK